MTRLLIYLSPHHAFGDEAGRLVRLQIENAIELGYSARDLMLVTNFPYAYGGVTARQVPDIYDAVDLTNKIPVIVHLLANGWLTADRYWYHDLDVYQLVRFEWPVRASAQIGVAKYGYKPEWQCGSIFFRPSALPVFVQWQAEVEAKPLTVTRRDEKALRRLVKLQRLNRRAVQEVNVTYNLSAMFVYRTYPTARQPIAAVHFHPNPADIERFIYGRNNKVDALGAAHPLVTPRVAALFRRHGLLDRPC